MSRVLIAVLCLVAAGGLGYATISDRWLENLSRSRHVSFSLLSSKRCVDGAAKTRTCESKSNTELMSELVMQPKEDASTAFATAGQATFGLSIVSAVLLLVCAGFLLGNKRTAGPNGPQHLTILALIFALIAATVFIKLKPGGPTGVGAGVGFWVFAVACVLGVFVTQSASKLIKPLDPEGDPSL
jgi:hypothetical protein